MLTIFRRKNSTEQVAANRLYAAIVEQSRRPDFYADWGVPDSLDGRFDSVLLHSYVVMARLGREGRSGRAVSQALYDVLFVEMDRAVREIGVGDLSVKRHVRRMMKAFNGRMMAYESNIGDFDALSAAVRRNVYGTLPEPVPAEWTQTLTRYLQDSAARVAAMDMDSLLNGRVDWAALPGAVQKEQERAAS